MRSTDNGEHWEWVINEGGVGIDVEVIDGGFAAISYSSSTLSRRIRISLDGGKTWNAIDEGLRPALTISSIKQIGKHLICGHPDGIFRSADMGKTWNNVHPSFDNAVRLLMVEHGILLPVVMEKCLRYMFPEMYCTLSRRVLDAEKSNGERGSKTRLAYAGRQNTIYLFNII